MSLTSIWPDLTSGSEVHEGAVRRVVVQLTGLQRRHARHRLARRLHVELVEVRGEVTGRRLHLCSRVLLLEELVDLVVLRDASARSPSSSAGWFRRVCRLSRRGAGRCAEGDASSLRSGGPRRARSRPAGRTRLVSFIAVPVTGFSDLIPEVAIPSMSSFWNATKKPTRGASDSVAIAKSEPYELCPPVASRNALSPSGTVHS